MKPSLGFTRRNKLTGVPGSGHNWFRDFIIYTKCQGRIAWRLTDVSLALKDNKLISLFYDQQLSWIPRVDDYVPRGNILETSEHGQIWLAKYHSYTTCRKTLAPSTAPAMALVGPTCFLARYWKWHCWNLLSPINAIRFCLYGFGVVVIFWQPQMPILVQNSWQRIARCSLNSKCRQILACQKPRSLLSCFAPFIVSWASRQSSIRRYLCLADPRRRQKGSIGCHIDDEIILTLLLTLFLTNVGSQVQLGSRWLLGTCSSRS